MSKNDWMYVNKIIIIIVIIFRHKKDADMKWDSEIKYKPPPDLAQELATECGVNIDRVRVEIPHLEELINSMTVYSQTQIDEALGALERVADQEKEVEKIR